MRASPSIIPRKALAGTYLLIVSPSIVLIDGFILFRMIAMHRVMSTKAHTPYHQLRRMATSTKLPRTFTHSLEHFIQRAKCLHLYRRIQRLVRGMDDITRKELKDWARNDFSRHRNETDLHKIKYLYSTGARQVQQMEASFALSRGKH